MEYAVKRFARWVLSTHALLLIAILAVVALGARRIYLRTVSLATEQAEERQTLLAEETAHGIESYYESIERDLNLFGKIGFDEPPTAAPVANRPIVAGLARVAGRAPLLWNQLEGRVSALFLYDNLTHNVLEFGHDDDGPAARDVVQRADEWLAQVQTPSVSRYQSFSGAGLNLVCVPVPDRPTKLLIAIVPVREIERRFLDTVNKAERGGKAGVSAMLFDDAHTTMAASDPHLIGLNLLFMDEQHIRALRDHATAGQQWTESIPKPIATGNSTLPPAMVTVHPIRLGTKVWALSVATPLASVDEVVNRVFRSALISAILLLVGLSAMLGLTATQLIRSRVRVERVKRELITHELDQAREIQLAWLPRKGLSSRTVDVAAINQPASHISGDFYNWFKLPDGRTAIIIGDVTGHGMAAAFLMSTTQLLVRMTLPRVRDAGTCLAEVNRELCLQVNNGQFVTMLIVVLDVAAGTLELATAGHFPPLVSNPDDGSFTSIPMEPQLALGIEPDITFPTERHAIDPEASLLLFTDGATDALAPDDTRFSTEQLSASLHGPYPSAEAMLESVNSAINTFRQSRPLSDDLTLVAVRLHPSPVAATTEPLPSSAVAGIAPAASLAAPAAAPVA